MPLHVLAECVVDLNTILSPFLPHAANAVDRVYGGTGNLSRCPGSKRSVTSTTAAVPTR